MRRLFRGVLFCPLNRGKSGAARIGGGERSEPVSRIVFMPYDTESKSRNVLASPLGEEGHEVAKGCTRVRMIMILDVDVTAERRHYNTHRPLKGKRLTTFCASLRSGGRRLAVRTAMEHPIGALPRTPFPASRDFAPVGSMSLDFQVASLSYKSSSFATSRGNERYEGKNSESYTSRTISAFPPFGGWRHHLPPTSWWDYGCLAMESCLYRKA